jgi:ferredoxin--NADP+ reductase
MMIFAIGDVHDPNLGLPCGPDGYLTLANPDDPNRPVYEVFDPQGGSPIEGTYVVGWARRASEGLVGIARHDGEVGAGHVVDYVASAPEKMSASVSEIARFLRRSGIEAVDKDDLAYLGQAEQVEAQQRHLTLFKYRDDVQMLRAIDVERSRSLVARSAA